MEVGPLNTAGNSLSRHAVVTTVILTCALTLGTVLAPRRAVAATAEELQAQLESASAKLDDLLAQTSSSISALQETRSAVEETQVLIDETRNALDDKAREVAAMQRDYAILIASDYKNHGNLGVLSFCLGATDFDDLVSRVYYAERVSEQKQHALSELRSAQEDMMNVQRDLQDKKASLEELASQQEEQVNSLQAARASQQSYIDSLPTEIQGALQEEKAEQLEATNSEAASIIEKVEKNPTGNKTTPSSESSSESSSSESSESSHVEETPSTPSDNGGGSQNTPESQPADSSGGSLSNVANYIGPQASWSYDTGYISAQQGILNSSGSGTNWGCVVDKGSGRCTVFRNDGGVWKAAMTTDVITTGHTFTGHFNVVFHSRAYWALPDGYDVNDWWVCFIEAWSGDNYSGHLRYESGKGYDDGQGFHFGYSSGGCTVIPNYSTAQWLYDHVPDGSRVIVY